MFMDPSNILAACNLQSTDTIADFGAGSGFVARAAAAFVPHGQVFAIEINRDIVARLTREITENRIKNIHPLWGDIEVRGGSQLIDSSVDFLILSNVMFHIDDKAGCINEATRVLKPGGRILLVDWKESFAGMGPAPHHVFTRQIAESLFSSMGYAVVIDTIPSGEHHYGILFRKQ